MKSMLAVAILGLVGAPLFATDGVMDAPWFTQFGLCGLFGGILWWVLAKTLPQLSADAKEAAIKVSQEHKDAAIKVAETNATSINMLVGKFDALGEKIERQTSEIRAQGDSQLALLRQNLVHKADKPKDGESTA